MDYITDFSGICAFSVAFRDLGWKPRAFFEIEDFPSAVLKHHYPSVPNYGDMSAHDFSVHKNLFMLAGGPPCQSFSKGGTGKSIADPRGQLLITHAHAIRTARPVWSITENVPDLLRTKDNAFGTFMGVITGSDGPLHSPLKRGKWPNEGMAEGPFGRVAWRVFDAKYFGVPQRRKRVFIVSGHRAWTDPAKVLFEHKGPEGRKTKERSEGVFPTSFNEHGHGKYAPGCGPGGENLIVVPCWWDGSQTSETLSRVLYKGQTMPEKQRFPAVIAIHQNQRGGPRLSETAYTLSTGGGKPGQGYQAVIDKLRIRRITPVEAERLQGFPDNYTNIPYGRPRYPDQICPDGHRYKAIGNSIAVPVIRWIARRITLQTPQ